MAKKASLKQDSAQRTGRSWFLHFTIAGILFIFMMSHSLAETTDGWQKYEQPSGGTLTSPYMVYWIHAPEKTEPGMPLVIYLHSSKGLLGRALKDAMPSLINDGTISDPQAIILVPQLPGDPDTAKWSDAADSVESIIQRVIDEYQVDPDRIAMTGFSLGAVYAWDFANETPGRYSRFLNVCGRVHYMSVSVESFTGCEVRTYTAYRDEAVRSETVINFVERLKEAGIDATTTELMMTHMEAPLYVFALDEIQEWLWMKPAEESGNAAGE